MRETVLSQVAGLVPRRGLVAVDGVDGAGKTMFADELAAHLRERGENVIRASVDGFHRERVSRFARGRDSPVGFYEDAFDYGAFRRELLDPFRERGHGAHYRPAVHDVRTDEYLDLPRRRVPADAILLVDGIFLQRLELDGCWDLTIWLDVEFAVSVPRMAARDGCSPRIEDNLRYVGGQRLYLATGPDRRADLVIDNNDLTNPRIIRRDRGSRRG